MRIRCGAWGCAAFSKSISGFWMTVTPVKPLNAPVKVPTVTPSAVKEFLLKPSMTSQNARDHVPPLALMTSCTSSLPKVLLSTQNESTASGNGLSETGPGKFVVADEGKTCSSRPEKNGYGSLLSPVRD